MISTTEEDQDMTSSTRNAIASNSPASTDADLFYLAGGDESEKIDRSADRDYLPMDVFVDPGTMKKHFQESSINERWIGARPAVA